MKKILSALMLSTLSTLTLAGEQTGKVIEIRVTSKTLGGHHTHVRIEGDYLNQPVCVDDVWKMWAIDTDTPAGQAMLSTILAAQMSGKPVTFWGSGSCHPDEPGPQGMEQLIQVGLRS